MNPDYQYLVNYEKKVKQQLAKANINYRSKNRDKINQLAKNYYKLSTIRIRTTINRSFEKEVKHTIIKRNKN